MELPLRIFSDLHLGHKASRIGEVEKLRPLFRGAGTVVFNGDTWEELSPPWREKSEEMLGQLRRILGEEGCDGVGMVNHLLLAGFAMTQIPVMMRIKLGQNLFRAY